MAKGPWFPTSLPKQYQMFTNVRQKIGNYGLTLGLVPALVAEIETICTQSIDSYDWLEGIDATKQAATQWRDLLYYADPKNGEHIGEPLPPVPEFTNLGPMTGVIGIVPRFKEIRAMIVKLDGYTEAIGEDLMIEGVEEDGLAEGDASPELKVSIELGYKVNITASRRGTDALRVEYKPAGGAWSTVAFLTKLPAQIVISPKTPGQPESGHIRAIFRKKNGNVGNYSPEYSVTVAP